MKRPYLLGFGRNCSLMPSEPPMSPELTTLGEHSVIWCNSPQEIFTTKQDFLVAMLHWFEQIQNLQLTVLPVRSGVRVSNVTYLAELLRVYQRELDLCFDKIEETSEYDMTISNKNSEPTNSGYSSLRRNVQSGKEYFERLKVWYQWKEREVLQAQEVIALIHRQLAPWIKDYRSETTPARGSEINLSFLVPNLCRQEFINAIEILLKSFSGQAQWSGPWPPFHFSSFSLQPASFLVYEALNWGGENYL